MDTKQKIAQHVFRGISSETSIGLLLAIYGPIFRKYLQPFLKYVSQDYRRLFTVFLSFCFATFRHPSSQRDVFLLCLIWLITDEHIDLNGNLDEYLAQTKSLLAKDKVEFCHPSLEAFAQILTEVTFPLEWFHDIFTVQCESITVQKNPDLTREQYLQFATRKGRVSTDLFDRVRGVQPRDHIGKAIQLLDDIFDWEDDISDGNHTVATHDIKTKGNIDDLFIEAVNEVFEIENIVDRTIIMNSLTCLIGMNGMSPELSSLLHDVKVCEQLDLGLWGRKLLEVA